MEHPAASALADMECLLIVSRTHNPIPQNEYSNQNELSGFVCT